MGRNLSKEELGFKRGLHGWDIDSEGSRANGFCVYERRGKRNNIGEDKSPYDLTNLTN